MAEAKSEAGKEKAARLLEACRELRFRGTARVARGSLSVARLRTLEAGALVHLDRPVGEPFELVLAGVPVVRGDLVSRRDGLVLRVTALGGQDER
jgi:flagellar motor switch/type III secretory pathway protein FliN